MKSWKFPAGELGICVDREDYGRYVLDFSMGSDSLIEMLLYVDAYRRDRGSNAPILLMAPYFPYARQDRVMQPGESHSLKVIANLINSCKFDSVITVDPHSDVVAALVDNLAIMEQHYAVLSVLNQKNISANYDFLIAPDAGALKKIYKLAEKVGLPVIAAQKVRDTSNGNITSTKVYDSDAALLKGARALVVDDICDGGRTFIELASVLPEMSRLDLYVTHGIFSKGREALEQAYDNIYCYHTI